MLTIWFMANVCFSHLERWARLYQFELCGGWRLEIRLVVEDFIPMWLTLHQNPGHQDLDEFPQLAEHAVCSQIAAWGRSAACNSGTGRGQPKLLVWTLPSGPFTFADFHLYPFAIENGSLGYNGFSEFCESFYWVIQSECALGNP